MESGVGKGFLDAGYAGADGTFAIEIGGAFSHRRARALTAEQDRHIGLVHVAIAIQIPDKFSWSEFTSFRSFVRQADPHHDSGVVDGSHR